MVSRRKEQKVFVLDTSAMIYQPMIVERLGDNIIIIPMSDLNELDGLKKQDGNVGYSAREAIACIEELTNNDLNPNSIVHGVSTKSGGTLFFDFIKPDEWGLLPDGIERNNDARVILAAIKARKKNPNRQVFVLSQDSNLRVITRTCGIKAEGYQNDTMITNLNEFYSGRRDITVPTPSTELLKEMKEKNRITVSGLGEFIPKPALFPNQCVTISLGGHFACGIHHQGEIKLISDGNGHLLYGHPNGKIPLKNNEQRLAYGLASSQEVELATFSGRTGSGKTFLALLGAYASTRDVDEFRIMVFRPHIDLGPALGMLPGGVEEKFSPWMRPVIENMVKIVKAYTNTSTDQARATIQGYLNHDFLEIKPISHIRGCTFDNAVIVIDEGQNLTPHEMRSTVTRAGENSRIFVTGDPTQIDNRFLDSRNNGLVFLTERFKGDPSFGHLTFERSVRSKLSEKAAELLA